MIKVKLFIFMNQLGGGGAERVTLNLINHLSNEKYDKYFVILNKEKSTYIRYLYNNVKVIDLNVMRLRKSFFKLRKLIKKEKPDIIFTTLFDNNIMIALQKMSFFHMKNTFKLVTRETISRKVSSKNRFKRFFEYLLVKFVYQIMSDIVIIMSKDSQDYFLDTFNISKNKVKVIYNPIDLRNITQEKKNIHSNLNKMIIINIGRLQKVKNQELLIRAFIPLKKQYNFELRILGKGPEKAHLQSLIDQLNLNEYIKLIGYVDNPYKWLYQSSIFVSSSNFEGFPNAILEAMAVGLPVISTNCHSGPSEIIKSDEFGLLVPTNDKEALTEAIKKLLDDENLRIHYAKQSIKRAQDFKVEKIIPQYEAVFDSLIEKT